MPIRDSSSLDQKVKLVICRIFLSSSLSEAKSSDTYSLTLFQPLSDLSVSLMDQLGSSIDVSFSFLKVFFSGFCAGSNEKIFR